MTPLVSTLLAVVLAVVGGAWGFVADRIAARWPEHEDGSPSGGDRLADARGRRASGALALGALHAALPAEPVAVR